MEKPEVDVITSGRQSLVVDHGTCRPADSYDLTNEDAERASAELNETTELREKCLRDLKQRLLNDKNISYRLDDAYLLRFLRIRKFDCDKAYKTIRAFYDTREKYPDYFAIPPNLEALLNLEFFTYLPYEDLGGRILFKTDYDNWNPSEVSFQEIFSLISAVSDISILNPRVQINGIVAVWNVGGMSARHLAQFMNPWCLALYFKIFQGCYPWRIKMIIGVNCGPLSRLFHKMVKPFVKTKIIERVVLLGSDMSELHKLMSPEVLPKQFGGKLEDAECSCTRHVLSNMEYLKYERSFGYTKEGKSDGAEAQ